MAALSAYAAAAAAPREWTAAAGLRLSDLFATPTTAPKRERPRTPLATMRAEAFAMGRRQAWADDGAVEQAAAADAIRWADRVRATAQDTEDGWTLLAAAAHVSTLADNILSEDVST